MIINKREIAKEYYNSLLELKDTESYITRKLYKKTCKIDKHKFIEEYPISTLEIVSYRTFWELLLELDIVKNPFHLDNPNADEFEIKLKKILDSLIYDETSKYNVDDIVSIFREYKLSA